ncbi:MAG: PH domain-containing protein [Erysipelotrichaceae bacterium]|nr:PH domain-containing protein [Erysipelotrichaceae bacterium]
MKKNNNLWKLIVTVVVLVAVFVLNFVGSIKSTLTDDALVVDGVFAQTSVEYKDITAVKLVDDISYGSRVGVSTFKLNSGTYTNTEYGTYTLYAYKNIGKHIVVYYGESAIMVFNCATAQETTDFYQLLLAKLN